MLIDEEEIIDSFKKTVCKYYPISLKTFNEILKCGNIITLSKGNIFTSLGQVPKTFGYIYKGLMRAYITDEKGNEYNKKFFHENTFPGSMVALLTKSESEFTIEAMEQTILIEIKQNCYRRLLMEKDDLKLFHIFYLENNWVIKKENREVSLVQKGATERFLEFCEDYPDLKRRIPDYHIASHLGITPTQLSRIKKTLKS